MYPNYLALIIARTEIKRDLLSGAFIEEHDGILCNEKQTVYMGVFSLTTAAI